MKRLSGIAIVGSSLIIAAVVLTAVFGLNTRTLHSTPLSAHLETAIEISPAAFSEMIQKEFYMPAAKAEEPTPEAREVLGQIYPANEHCSIQKHKGARMMAMADCR